jgi:hypothetical protein
MRVYLRFIKGLSWVYEDYPLSSESTPLVIPQETTQAKLQAYNCSLLRNNFPVPYAIFIGSNPVDDE